MKKNLIKRVIVGVGVVVTTLSLGTFMGSSPVALAEDPDITETANEDTKTVLVNLFFQPVAGKAVKITSAFPEIDDSQFGKINMNDLLKVEFTGQFVEGKSPYDELSIILQYAGKSSERNQGIAQLVKIFQMEGFNDERLLAFATSQFDRGSQLIISNHLQGMTIDLAKTRTEANNQAVMSKLDSSDPDYDQAQYKAQDFYIYLKPQSVSSTVASQTSLTANQHATITVGQLVDATTFNAKATNSAGDTIPVTVDTSQANLKKPGTYSVTLKAENGESKTVTLTVQAAPSPVVPNQAVVYGLKKIYLYQKPTFKPHQRVAAYPKAKRTNRPMFKVIGYARSKSGLLRYQVKDAAGKTGYITAKSAFVAPVYYQKSVKKIKVLNKQGINRYQDLKLSKTGKHVKAGKTLKVVGLKHYHLTTRFELSNGQYISANKKLVVVVK